MLTLLAHVRVRVSLSLPVAVSLICPPAPSISIVFLYLQLMEMGFAEVRAKKGLMFGQGSDMEHAINWLMEHQEDADIDDPIPEGALEAMDVDVPAAGGAYRFYTGPTGISPDFVATGLKRAKTN